MTVMDASEVLDELARLRAEVRELRAGRGRWRFGVSWRRLAAVGLGTALVAGSVIGVAGASPTTSTTDVTFVTLTPAHKVLSATIAANKSTVAVVSGGSTTVPTNATTVQVVLTAKGVKAGVINIYPTGNISGGSGQFLSYPGFNTVESATIQENIGQANELTFANSGFGSATVTATVTGYSTQVTAGDINGIGGSAGQVLTNDGPAGVSWGPGGGAVYADQQTSIDFLTTSASAVVSVTVPAGTYAVSVNADARSTKAGFDEVACYLLTPTGTIIDDSFTELNGQSYFAEPVSLSGVMTTTGGSVNLNCFDTYGSDFSLVQHGWLIVTQIQSVTGSVVSN
jgi:hypothetical protein